MTIDFAIFVAFDFMRSSSFHPIDSHINIVFTVYYHSDEIEEEKRSQIDSTEKVQRINWIRLSEFKSIHIHERDEKNARKADCK